MSTTAIQASSATTNAYGLMATPCPLTGQDPKTRVTFDPKQTSTPAAFTTDAAREHTEAHPVSDKATTANPGAQLAGLSIVHALVDGALVPTVCPTRFCNENHTDENTGHLEDVGHGSAHVDVYVPNFRTGDDEFFAYANLDQDPYSKNPKARAAYIRIDDGGGQDWQMTPDQADRFADSLTVFAGRIHALARVARTPADRMPESTDTPAACPDGITWCEGNPSTHADPREHRHEGPEYGLTGSYVQGARTEGIVAFQLAQWDDDEPRLVFQSDGTWPDLGLPQVDELIGDAVPWLAKLIATRRRLAIEVSPNRSTVPFTESEDKQTASGAFDLATTAIDVALAKTEDRAGMLRALRSFLDMTEDEQA